MILSYMGSPPPTRGTPYSAKPPELTPRITPAYAGNTDLCKDINGVIEDHPRLRGEHVAVIDTK